MFTKSLIRRLTRRMAHGLFVALLTMLSPTLPAAHASASSDAAGLQSYRTLVGDMNGDGKTDLIWNETTADGNHIRVDISQGDGSFVKTSLQDAGGGGWQNYRTLVGDVNGD